MHPSPRLERRAHALSQRPSSRARGAGLGCSVKHNALTPASPAPYSRPLALWAGKLRRRVCRHRVGARPSAGCACAPPAQRWLKAPASFFFQRRMAQRRRDVSLCSGSSSVPTRPAPPPTLSTGTAKQRKARLDWMPRQPQGGGWWVGRARTPYSVAELNSRSVDNTNNHSAAWRRQRAASSGGLPRCSGHLHLQTLRRTWLAVVCRGLGGRGRQWWWL